MSGSYQVSAALGYYGSWTANDVAYVHLYKNGSSYSKTSLGTGSSATSYLVPVLQDALFLNAGEYIDIRGANDRNYSLISNVVTDAFKIERLSGPSQIAATETVAARYSTTAGQAVNTTATLVDFGTKDYDSHGAVTTGGSWKFTAPVSGIFRVSGELIIAAARATFWWRVDKNGSSYYWGGHSMGGGATGTVTQNSGTIRLLSGDYISIYTYVDTSATTLGTAAGHNWVAIERIGNYV
jgi:hypothetical protein